MTQVLKCYGPPGTGKTTFLMDRLETELKKVKPRRVGFLTFTRSARETVLDRIKISQGDLPFLRTIHAVCYRQLNISQSQMVRTKDLQRFGQMIGVSLSGSQDNFYSADLRDLSSADMLLHLNHLGRHKRIMLNESLRFSPLTLDVHFARWFTVAYRQWKIREGLYDFTDLLTEYLASGDPLDIEVLFVDEAQDLSILQWDVVAKLGANAQRIYICGDDDQAVFSWAGADAKRFIDYPANEVKVLDMSYRLPKKIHQLAQRVSQRIENRYPKEFKPRNEDGEVRGAGWISGSLAKKDTFVLFRNHVRGRELAQSLEEEGVPFAGECSILTRGVTGRAIRGVCRAVRNKPMSLEEAQAVLEFASSSWIRPDAKQFLKDSGRREIFYDELFVRKPTDDTVAEVLRLLPKREYLDRCIRFYSLEAVSDPQIQLMSIHQSKGREASTVILDLDMTRRTYESSLADPDDEHRVFYVGITRAKERLITLMPTATQYYQL